MTTRTVDWKKEAASKLQEDDIELAFMKQVNTFVENRAKPIFKEPYRLGFEIVYRNDDNTRIVGVYAFRIGEDLFLAPSFFINGEIKGVEMLYNSREKLFVPLVTEWCDYIKGRYETELGSPVKKPRGARGDIDIDHLKHPEGARGTKRASIIKVADECIENLDSMFTDTPPQPDQNSYERVLEAFSTGGLKTANTFTEMLSNYDYADALYRSYGEKFFDLLEPGQPQVTKRASVKPLLTLHVGTFNPDTKVAFDQQIKRGYSFEDYREETQFEPIYEASTEGWGEISKSGVYDIVDSKGDTVRATVIFKDDCRKDHDLFETVDTNTKYVIFSDGSHNTFYDKPLYARNEDSGEESETEELGISLGELKGQKRGFIYDPASGYVSGVKYVKRKAKNDGVVEFVVDYCEMDDEDCDYYESFFYNPDSDVGDKKHNYLSSSTRFISAKDEHNNTFTPGDVNSVTKVFAASGCKRASIYKVPQRNRYIFSDPYGNRTSPVSKVAAIATAMVNFNIPEGEAEALIDGANENPSGYEFFTKCAEQITIPFGEEDFFRSFDADHGVPWEYPDSVVLVGENVGEDAPVPRLDDVVENEGLDFVTASPMQMFEVAQNTGVRSVFDHGVIGSLVSTYDATTMIEKFLPDLKQGLDKIARMIFLYYWKPEDFNDLYGSDDSTEMENLLISTFKQFGDLVLKLLEKTDTELSSSGN